MICTACLKNYKSKATLQAHQRKTCKTFLQRKKERKHLNSYYTECLIHINPNIADIVYQYIGTTNKINITSILTDFVDIASWFKCNKQYVPLLSTRSMICLLEDISLYLYKINGKHMLLQEFANGMNFGISTEIPINMKEEFLYHLLKLKDILQIFRQHSKFSKKYILLNHCDNILKWCSIVIHDYTKLKWI